MHPFWEKKGVELQFMVKTYFLPAPLVNVELQNLPQILWVIRQNKSVTLQAMKASG
jgi:hypothetical protein